MRGTLTQQDLERQLTEQELSRDDEELSNRKIRKLRENRDSFLPKEQSPTKQKQEQGPDSQTQLFSKSDNLFSGASLSNNIFARCLEEKGDNNIFAKNPHSVNLFNPLPMPVKPCQPMPETEDSNSSNLLLEEGSNVTLCDTLKSIPEEVQVQRLSEQPKVVMKQQAKSEDCYTKLHSMKVKKLRHGDSPLLTDVEVSLEKPLEDSGWLTLVVRDQLTKRILYQTILLLERVQVTEFMQKPENVLMEVWKPKETAAGFTREILKMQLGDPKDSERLRKIIEKERRKSSATPKQQIKPRQPRLCISNIPSQLKQSSQAEQEKSVSSNLTASFGQSPEVQYPTITVIPPREDFPVCQK